MAKLKDLVGHRCGRLIVIERAGSRGRASRWRCQCDCGKEHFAIGTALRRGTTKSAPLPSRSHAEIVFKLAQLSLHGDIRLPEKENAARELNQQLEGRLAGIAEKADHLARSRTSDERKAADLAGLLQHWMIHGKPRRDPKQKKLADKTNE